MPLSLPHWMERIRKPKHGQTESGREIPNPIPMAPPVGFKPAPSLADQIREMVRSERLAREVMEAGYETFEESDDFDIGDDYDPQSPWEIPADADTVKDMKKRRDDAVQAEKDRAASPPPQPATKSPTEPLQGDNKPAKPAGDQEREKPAQK